MVLRSMHADACPVHGLNRKRAACRACNAAYMRAYLRRQRVEQPAAALFERAKDRARRRNVPFSLRRSDILIPTRCPVLRIPIVPGPARSACSPSLDRITAERGYVPGNVRVISDHANRLKSAHGLPELRRLTESGPGALRADYRAVVRYVEREALLVQVRERAALGGRHGQEWAKIAEFLARVFERGD